MRLGKDAIIFTLEEGGKQASAALLSLTYLREAAAARAGSVGASAAAAAEDGVAGGGVCPYVVPLLTWERGADGVYKVRPCLTGCLV
jgi:hypothetical protein